MNETQLQNPKRATRRVPNNWLVMLGLLVPLVGGADKCERATVGDDCNAMGAAGAEGCKADSCEYHGKTLDVGDSVPAADGCNTCTCTDSGGVACTEKACSQGCGGIAGTQCAEGTFCNYDIHAKCGAADLTGVCEPIPEACDLIYKPVCGCDDKTYGNSCAAAAAGVSIVAEGECGAGGGGTGGCEYEGSFYKAGEAFLAADGCNTCSCDEKGGVICTKIGCSGTHCGGLEGAQCAPGEYCSYRPEALCGAADATGFCVTLEETSCTAEYAPVCGCDGNTYGNACEASSKGASIAHDGECESGCVFGDASFAQGTSVICPDGCNTCFCSEGGAWNQTLIGCEAPKLEVCTEAEIEDASLKATPLYLEKDSLALAVTYSGGCSAHSFKLCYAGALDKSLPVQARLWLVDTTTPKDSCEALISDELVFDVSLLREKHSAEKLIILSGDGGGLKYVF